MTGLESRTPTANYQHTGSAGTKHRDVHSPIEMASSSKRTRGTIVKLDSGNGDDLSKISWIHPIAWIHKAGYSAVSPKRPAHLERNREAHLEQSSQPYLMRYAPERRMEVNKRSEVNRIPECGWTKHSCCSEVES